MKRNPLPVRKLARELSLRLMLPLLLIVAATGLLGGYGAQRLVDGVFDHWLMDSARSLGAQVQFVNGQARVALNPQAQALLTYDKLDTTYFAVEQGETLLLGRADIPRQGEREQRYASDERAYDAVLQGTPVRVASVLLDGPGGARTEVRMAETRVKRQEARLDLLLTMAPMVVLVLGTAVVIGVVIRRTISPLARMASRWNERSHASLDAIEVDDVPRELLPFATALNDLLARQRQMLERQRQFTANVAHQLRTPLTGLSLGLARAAESNELTEVRRVLRELEQTTQRTARMVQQMLALSRLGPEMGSGIKLTPTDLVALCREVAESYLDAALERQIEMEFIGPDAPWMQPAQPELLAEAIGNLLDNALRYTPKGGALQVMVDPSLRRIGISDSGPGISENDRQAVLQRYVRGSAAHGDGSGLGLAIVGEIAQLHGAEVLIEHAVLGGACISLRFGSGQGSGPARADSDASMA